MNKISIITVFIFISFLAKSQINKNGIPFIKNYSQEIYDAAGQNWAIIKDDRGYMYFGNNYGLLEYNGSRWSLKYDPNFSSTILSLAKDHRGTIYFGSIGQFGLMIPDSIGDLQFLFLSDFLNIDNGEDAIRGIHIVNDRVIYRSANKIYSFKIPVNIENKKEILENMQVFEPDNSFHVSFNIYNKFYVREKGKGLLVLDKNKLKLIPGGERFADDKVYIMLPFGTKEILIISRNQGFFIYNPASKSISKFHCEADSLIKAGYSYGGVAISENKYAVATLANGVIIFNKNGKILEILNEQSGLPDQMVLSIYFDKTQGNLWFATNENGIFNVNIESPFRVWNRESGLEGVVADVIRYNNTIYIATSTGVFYLDTIQNNFAGFTHIENIMFEAWSFQKFRHNKKQKLLVGTANGVYEITGKSAKIIGKPAYVYKLFQSAVNPNKLFVGFNDGIGQYIYDGGKWVFSGKNDKIENSIRDIYEKGDSEIYLGTAASGYILLDSIFDINPMVIDTTQGLVLFSNDYKVSEINNKIIFTSGKGLFEYNKEKNIVLPFKKFGNEFTQKNYGVSLINKDNDDFWLGVFSNDLNKNKWQGIVRLINKKNGHFEKKYDFAKILPEKVPLVIYQDSNYTWIANEKGLYKYDKNDNKNYNLKFNAFITSVSTKNDSVIFKGIYKSASDTGFYYTIVQSDNSVPVLHFKNNKLTFEYSAGFYEQEDRTLYSYRLLGFNDKWSKWTTEHKFTYTNIHEGEFTFQVKAKNIYGTESIIANYKFIILPPWYRTVWAYIFYVVFAFLLIWAIVKYNTRRLKQDKERLERIVAERTKEIKEQHDKIAELHKSIMDSIIYARRIQEALLPPDEFLKDLLPEYFVLFKPRDIVSGDFYWASHHEGKAILVAADCTGHGVPGAFMSMLGISFLNEIVNKIEHLESHKILNELRANVKKSLRQTGKDNEAKDGMDMALCIIDYDNMQMEYSGAFNSLYLIRNGELIKYDADRMPIGIYIREKETFTKHVVQLQKGDAFYIFSDGFVDQFGGPKGSKLMTKRFKQLLLDNYTKSMEEQKTILNNFLEEWQSYTNEKGENYRQIDDILVIGVRI